MGETVLAVDLGGTNLRIAAIGRDGSITCRSRCSTPHKNDTGSIIDAISDLAQECLLELGDASLVHAIGVAVPAVIGIPKGIICRSPNLPMLNGLHFSDELKRKTGLDVVLENDATSAAIGEHWLGASRGIDNSICVTLGTGVGGGIILNGRPLRGPDGTGG